MDACGGIETPPTRGEAGPPKDEEPETCGDICRENEGYWMPEPLAMDAETWCD